MKQLLILFLAITSLLPGPSVAAPLLVPAPPKIGADIYYLMDFDSTEVLGESGSDTRVEPASLTKMMTVYVAADELKKGRIRKDDTTIVSEKAWRTGGSKMFIKVDTEVSVDQLLHGIIVQSGNDACVALAEHISGEEAIFVSLMNYHAERLGMRSSHFANSTGWPDPGNYTTAHDMALLASHLIRDFPEIYKLFSIKEYTYNKIRQTNRNLLLMRDKSVDGIKTGHTESAGYCLVASGLQNGMRLISVVMGMSSDKARIRASHTLLKYGFRFFETHRLYGAGDTLIDARIWKGNAKTIPLGLKRSLYVTIPRGRYPELQANIDFTTKLIAPISAGESFGNLRLTLGGTEFKSLPLETLESVAKGGMIDQLMDHMRLMVDWDNLF